jgi:hypothetical protein
LDVSTESPITGNDFGVEPGKIQDERGYQCAQCGEFIAYHIGDTEWRIHTARGWIQ